MAAMSRKNMSRKLPASTSSAASTTNTRLKKVMVFSRMISPVDFRLVSSTRLCHPAAASWAAWAWVRPCSGVGK